MKDISAVIIIDGKATISSDDVKKLNDELTFPELCFLNPFIDQVDEKSYGEIECTAKGCEVVNDEDAKFCKGCGTQLRRPENDSFNITDLCWCGDDTGNSWSRVFVKRVAPKIHGSLDAVLVISSAEDDDPPKLMGIKLRDGIVTRCEVSVELKAVNELRPSKDR